MTPIVAAILILVSLFLAFSIGIPVAFSLLGVAIIFGTIILGPAAPYMAVTSAFHAMTSDVFLAVPLFVIMAALLERSGIGADLYEAAYRWMGPLRGGLAIGTIVICTLIAAMTGLGATGVSMMGMLARTEMYKRGYQKELVLGSIAAGGTLGPIIPPSVIMIILGQLGEESVGKLFIGGAIPGLILAGLFCAYIAIKCTIDPKAGPAVPKEERSTWKEKIVLLRNLILPISIIVLVLGSIYLGITTTTEAGGIGAIGALAAAAIHRKLTWPNLKEALKSATMITVMIMWIAIGGSTFGSIMTTTGISDTLRDSVLSLSLSPIVIVSLIMIIALIMGMFMDSLPIIMILIPISIPIIQVLGIDKLYFLVVFTVAVVTGYISPPFGVNLFYLKGVAPEEEMSTLYRAAVPFTIVMVIGVFLFAFVPSLVVWLPNQMIK